MNKIHVASAFALGGLSHEAILQLVALLLKIFLP